MILINKPEYESCQRYDNNNGKQIIEKKFVTSFKVILELWTD